MKKININEKNATLLSDTITQIVNSYAKNDKVDCIYLQCFYSKNSETIIELVLIYRGSSYEEDLSILDNTLEAIKEKTRIALIINGVGPTNYDPIMMHSREISACRELYNSSILFDRTGFYTNIQKRLVNDKIATIPFSNSVEFDPPLQLVKQVK